MWLVGVTRHCLNPCAYKSYLAKGTTTYFTQFSTYSMDPSLKTTSLLFCTVYGYVNWSIMQVSSAHLIWLPFQESWHIAVCVCGSGVTSSLHTNFHNAMGSSDSISLTSPSQPQESCSMAWGTWPQPPQHSCLKMSCRIISFRAGNRDAPVPTSLLYTGKNLLLSNTHIHEVLWACPPMFDEPVSNMIYPPICRGVVEKAYEY